MEIEFAGNVKLFSFSAAGSAQAHLSFTITRALREPQSASIRLPSFAFHPAWPGVLAVYRVEETKDDSSFMAPVADYFHPGSERAEYT